MGTRFFTRIRIALKILEKIFDSFVLSKAVNLDYVTSQQRMCFFIRSPVEILFSDGLYGLQAGNVIDAALSLNL